MSSVRVMLIGLALVTVCPSVYAGPRFHIGLHFGRPLYRPCYWEPPCHRYRYHCVRPTRVYIERPVYVRPRPIVIEQPEIVVRPAPIVPSTSRSTAPPDNFRPADVRPVSTQPPPLAENIRRNADASTYVRQLRSADERVRSDAAIKLGRMKAESAVHDLTATLAGDSSPAVRETAARALGLIGSSRGLAALTHAAQSDNDRDVRRTAQFAVEIIQVNRR